MKPSPNFTNSRREGPTDRGKELQVGTSGRTPHLRTHSMSTSGEPIPFQRGWRKPGLVVAQNTKPSAQSLHHAGAIPKRKEKKESHEVENKDDESSAKQKRHVKRRVTSDVSRKKERDQHVPKVNTSGFTDLGKDQGRVWDAPNRNTPNHGNLNKITRKHFRQQKSTRENKIGQKATREVCETAPNSLPVKRQSSDGGNEPSSNFSRGQSHDKSSTTRPPAVGVRVKDSKTVQSVGGESHGSLPPDGNINSQGTSNDSRIVKHSEKQTESSSPVGSLHIFRENCNPLSSELINRSDMDERIPNSSVRSLRSNQVGSQASEGGVMNSSPLLMATQEQQSDGHSLASGLTSPMSNSNSLETFSPRDRISLDSSSPLSRTYPALDGDRVVDRQRNLNFSRLQNRITPAEQNAYGRFQRDNLERLTTERTVSLGTRDEVDSESSSDEHDDDLLSYELFRLGSPEIRTNASSSFSERPRVVRASRNVSPFSSLSNRVGQDLNSSPISDENEPNLFGGRELRGMRSISPLVQEPPARLLSRQTNRDDYTAFRNRQIQRDRERVRQRLVNTASDGTLLQPQSSHSPRQSIYSTASSRLPSLTPLRHGEALSHQSPTRDSLLGATRSSETPPPSPTQETFRSRRDGENVTNHLALMACPLFAPLLFELPPAIMIQMLTSARQELGDEFVQLLIENIVLSLLAQQMHDAGLTSDTGDLVGSRPPPATEELIENLTKRKITAEMKEKEFKCAICHVEYELQETVTELSCCHFFHSTCISVWLNKTATCPVCRFNLQEK
ncbi:uncharacterized protein [Apostichopus japonicus]|uniref:uncharacterized protein isoform X2 n=1 Tax=Stichopus japonicus TaxID=307972 RepID=UPI003AB5A27A